MAFQNPSRQTEPAPRTRNRLLWWFGIYLAAQLPLIPLVLPLRGWMRFLFPTGMAWPLIYLTGGLLARIGKVGSAYGEYFVITLMIVPWILYAVHLFLSLSVRSRRHFLILLWILGALVLFNLGSCAYFLHEPFE